MQDRWNGQFVQYYTLYVLYLVMNLFYLSDKKNKRWKRNIVTRKVTELCDEWIRSNQHDGHLWAICAFFCPIHREVAQLVPYDFSWKNRGNLRIAIVKLAEINGIQKRRLHLWHWYMFLSYFWYKACAILILTSEINVSCIWIFFQTRSCFKMSLKI